MPETTTALREPPRVSGGEGATGHLEELRDDPIGLMRRVRDECGGVGEFRLADRQVVLLSGAEPNEWFFRATEDDLDQAEPYADIESFHRRDAARAGLVELVEGIMRSRQQGPEATDDDRDLLDVLMSINDEGGTPRFSADYITGAFISMMFAGHHTTSGTA